jgi:hypothetical protein
MRRWLVARSRISSAMPVRDSRMSSAKTSPRRFPPPWSIEELMESFVIKERPGRH